MADKIAVTAAPAETAKAANDGADRSLTLQTTQKSSLEIAIEAQEAFDAQQAAAANADTQEVTPEVKAEETVTPPEKEEATETKAITPVTPEESEDGIGIDEQGKSYVRPSRLKDLLETKGKHKELVEALARKAVNPATPKATEKTDEKPAEVNAAQARVTAVREKLKEANASFDQEAITAAQEEMIDAKTDLKVAEQVAKARAEDRQETEARGWHGKLSDAEKAHEEVRNMLWEEDTQRLAAIDPELDLTDKDSDFYKAVDAKYKALAAAGNPVALRPKAFRMCVEMTAEEFGIDLPPTGTPAAPAQRPASPAKSQTVVTHRKNSSVVAPTSPGGKLAVTQEQLKNHINSLPPKERFEMLSQIEEAQQKAKAA